MKPHRNIILRHGQSVFVHTPSGSVSISTDLHQDDGSTADVVQIGAHSTDGFRLRVNPDSQGITCTVHIIEPQKSVSQ